MADGSLVKLLIKTNLSDRIKWKTVEDTFVYQYDKDGILGKAKGVIHKVPSTASEALKSSLMGTLEKNRCQKFFEFIQDYKKNDPKTQNGLPPDTLFKDVIKKFWLEPNTVDFVGHAVALYTNDDFLEQKVEITIDKMHAIIFPFIRKIW